MENADRQAKGLPALLEDPAELQEILRVSIYLFFFLLCLLGLYLSSICVDFMVNFWVLLAFKSISSKTGDPGAIDAGRSNDHVASQQLLSADITGAFRVG